MDELARQLARHGLQLVFLIVLLEQAGLPIPSMPVLVLCGALAARGEMSVALVLLTATFASLVADLVWFGLGRRRGRRILKTICRISLSPDSCVRQTERLFHRYGLYSVAVAKFIPGFSTVAPPLAGAMRVGLGRFILVAVVAALAWVGAAVAIGWFFHDAIGEVAEWVEGLGFWGFALVGSLLVGYVAFKWWQRSRFYKQLRMARVTPEELQRLLDDAVDTLVVDVRTAEGRQQDPRRISGALILDAENPEEFDARLAAWPRDSDIILYCT